MCFDPGIEEIRFRRSAPSFSQSSRESKKFDPDGRHQISSCVLYAGVAHPVERHLAKVEVASSSLVTRSIRTGNAFAFPVF